MPLPGFIPDVDGYMYTRLHTSQLPSTSTACQHQYQSSDWLWWPSPKWRSLCRVKLYTNSKPYGLRQSRLLFCFRRHRRKRFRLLRSTLLFRGLSVCLSRCPSRSYIVLKRQKSIRFLLHTTARCVCHWQITLKFGLHQSTPSSPYFAPKWPTHVDLSVIDIRWQIAAEWGELAQWSQWRAYRKPPSLFRMVPWLTPYDLPFPPMWVPNACQGQLCRACCQLANMIEDSLFV